MVDQVVKGGRALREPALVSDPARDDEFWGPEIIVNGVKPEWLAPQEPYLWPQTSRWIDHLRTRHSYQSPFAESTAGWAWRLDDARPNIVAIRLPADHPAYSRDSDGSPEGRDAQRLDGEAATARAEGIAHPRSRTMNTHSTTSNEGWIEWNGGECPVSRGTQVAVKFRDGDTDASETAGYWSGPIYDWWQHVNDDCDIIAYRVVQP